MSNESQKKIINIFSFEIENDFVKNVQQINLINEKHPNFSIAYFDLNNCVRSPCTPPLKKQYKTK